MCIILYHAYLQFSHPRLLPCLTCSHMIHCKSYKGMVEDTQKRRPTACNLPLRLKLHTKVLPRCQLPLLLHQPRSRYVLSQHPPQSKHWCLMLMGVEFFFFCWFGWWFRCWQMIHRCIFYVDVGIWIWNWWVGGSAEEFEVILNARTREASLVGLLLVLATCCECVCVCVCVVLPKHDAACTTWVLP